MEKLKKLAAEAACDYVKDGMIVGVGTGSTVKHFITKLAKENKKVVVIPTSKETQRMLERHGFMIGSINELVPDICVDGADEVDPKKRLIKGGGGALTREKIIAYRAKKFVVIVDESKRVKHLGQTHPLPVEVLPFAYERVRKELEKHFKKVEKREFVTDNGNYILDCHGKIENPKKLEVKLNNTPGEVENGLFTRSVYKVLIGTKKGLEKM